MDFKSDSKSLPNIPSAHADEFGRDMLWSEYDMLQFWQASRLWFADRGLYLFETSDKPIKNVARPLWLRPLDFNQQPSVPPYAVCIPPEMALPRPLRIIQQFAFAQDAKRRDLVIKLVENGSSHHRIFQRLLRDETFANSRTFPCVLPPVAILEPPHNYSFVVMPLWGELNSTRLQTMETVREVLHFMDCLLQGLTFLHTHKIVHRDITHINIMVNCYRYARFAEGFLDDLRRHQKGGNVYYALMDFDQSLILPTDTEIQTCCRPFIESLFGSGMYKPRDVDLGEPTYNPFAFDVAMLGNLFRMNLTNVVPCVPACAALFDKMTTHVVPQRFTAEQALRFLRDSTGTLDQAT